MLFQVHLTIIYKDQVPDSDTLLEIPGGDNCVYKYYCSPFDALWLVLHTFQTTLTSIHLILVIDHWGKLRAIFMFIVQRNDGMFQKFHSSFWIPRIFKLEVFYSVLLVRKLTYRDLWSAQALCLVTVILMSFLWHQYFCFDDQNWSDRSLPFLDKRQPCWVVQEHSRNKNRDEVASIKGSHCFPTWLTWKMKKMKNYQKASEGRVGREDYLSAFWPPPWNRREWALSGFSGSGKTGVPSPTGAQASVSPSWGWRAQSVLSTFGRSQGVVVKCEGVARTLGYWSQLSMFLPGWIRFSHLSVGLTTIFSVIQGLSWQMVLNVIL